MNTIEQQLWDYIDGNLDPLQIKAIQQKIETDAAVKQQYEEFLNLHLAFDHMELEEPSMSFTRNVMESVALAPAPIALSTKVNTNIIYGIAGFFIISLMALFGYALYHSELEFSRFNTGIDLTLNWSKLITTKTIYCFLFADLVIGLILLDNLLRKKANLL